MEDISTIKYYVNHPKTIEVIAWKEKDRYFLMVRTYRNHISSTREHETYSYSRWWDEFTKEFDTKASANAYFLKIRNRNTSLSPSIPDEKVYTLVERYMQNRNEFNERQERNRAIAEEIESRYGEGARQAEELARKEREKQESWLEGVDFEMA